jgi:hypothetical protein
MTVPDLVAAGHQTLSDYLWGMVADLDNIEENGHLTASMQEDVQEAKERLEALRNKSMRRAAEEGGR